MRQEDNEAAIVFAGKAWDVLRWVLADEAWTRQHCVESAAWYGYMEGVAAGRRTRVEDDGGILDQLQDMYETRTPG